MAKYLEVDGSQWVTVKSVCEDMRVDYARRREKLLESPITRKLIKAPGRDGKNYMMWCIPSETAHEFKKIAATYSRGPYNKEEH